MCFIFLRFIVSRYWTLGQYNLDATTLNEGFLTSCEALRQRTLKCPPLRLRLGAIRVATGPARLSRGFDLPGDGRGHCGRLDLPATRIFRHTQKDRAAFQIYGPCSAFEAEDRLRTQTGDSHILKSQLSPGFHARSHCRVLADTVAH